MNITFVIASLSAGGAERVIANLVNAFIEEGDDINLIIFKDIIKYSIDERVKVHVISEKRHGISYVVGSAAKLRRRLKSIKPDVVVSFLTEINVISILACMGTPYKLIVSERNDPYNIPRNKAYRILRKVLYPFSDAFVFQTKQAQKYFCKNIQKRSCIIHNPICGIDEVPAPCAEQVFEIVSVGRLEPQKNFELLIDGFCDFHKKHNDSTLTIYGEGSMRKKLEEKVKSLSLEQSIFLPGNQEKIVSKIAGKSLFVLSSDFEGMSNALMEAMAVGLPCIATDCPIGGSKELIFDHVNGILIPVRNVEKLTEAMEELYENQILREKLGNEARKIKETHSVEKITAEWKNMINKVLR